MHESHRELPTLPVPEQKRFLRESFLALLSSYSLNPELKARLASTFSLIDSRILDSQGMPKKLSSGAISQERSNLSKIREAIDVALSQLAADALKEAFETGKDDQGLAQIDDQKNQLEAHLLGVVESYETILDFIEFPDHFKQIDSDKEKSEEEIVDTFLQTHDGIKSGLDHIEKYYDLKSRKIVTSKLEDVRRESGVVDLLIAMVRKQIERQFAGKTGEQIKEKVIIEQELLEPLVFLNENLLKTLIQEEQLKYDKEELNKLLHGENGPLERNPHTSLLALCSEAFSFSVSSPDLASLSDIKGLNQRIRQTEKEAKQDFGLVVRRMIPQKYLELLDEYYDTEYTAKALEALQKLEKIFLRDYEVVFHSLETEADKQIEKVRLLSSTDLSEIQKLSDTLGNCQNDLQVLNQIKFYVIEGQASGNDVESKVELKLSEVNKNLKLLSDKEFEAWKGTILPSDPDLIQLFQLQHDAQELLDSATHSDKSAMKEISQRLVRENDELKKKFSSKTSSLHLLTRPKAKAHLDGLLETLQPLMSEVAERVSTLNEQAKQDLKKRMADLVDSILALQSEDDVSATVLKTTYSLANINSTYVDPLKILEDEFSEGDLNPSAVSPRYSDAKAKLSSLVESAQIRAKTFAELVTIAINKNFDVFVDAKLTRNISDHYERAVVKQLQAYYFTETESLGVKKTDGTIDESHSDTINERIEHRRQKVRIFAYRYRDDNYGKKHVPAAEQSNLYTNINGRRLLRRDILEGVTHHPEFGDASREMLKYAVEVMSEDRATKKMKPDGKFYTARELGVSYDDLKENPEGPLKFESHLKEMFLGTGPGKMNEEHFGIVWNLFIDFDLASISLVKCQKGTKTRSHNFTKPVDTEYLSYPLHVLTHKTYRYGNLDSAHQHLYVFTGIHPDTKEYDQYGKLVYRDDSGNVTTPDKGSPYIWRGNEHVRNGTHVRTARATQNLVKLFIKAYFPLKGIENSVYPNDAGSEVWNQSVFPDHLEYLTASEKDIGNLDLYTTAQRGWEKMLKMTVGAMKTDLTDQDIFNAEKGLYQEFLNNGMGLAKVVKGRHHDWFVPMLRYFIGRLASNYHEKNNETERFELRKKLVEQLKLGTGVPRGARGFEELLTELEGKGTYFFGSRWNGLPDLLRPSHNGARRNERVAYMKAWFKDKTGLAAPSSNDLTSALRTAVPGTAEDIKTYYDAIAEKIPLPAIIDRSATSTDTSDKKAA